MNIYVPSSNRKTPPSYSHIRLPLITTYRLALEDAHSKSISRPHLIPHLRTLPRPRPLPKRINTIHPRHRSRRPQPLQLPPQRPPYILMLPFILIMLPLGLHKSILRLPSPLLHLPNLLIQLHHLVLRLLHQPVVLVDLLLQRHQHRLPDGRAVDAIDCRAHIGQWRRRPPRLRVCDHGLGSALLRWPGGGAGPGP